MIKLDAFFISWIEIEQFFYGCNATYPKINDFTKENFGKSLSFSEPINLSKNRLFSNDRKWETAVYCWFN